jgi:energy-coupling factor transporter ATP-binding protein EcfA2
MDFAELGYYIHSPVRYYSTGMLVRLAFSISVHLEPEVLLVDEALSVGDTYFQAKSLDRMRWLRRERNSTIVLVTHNHEIVEEMCDEVIWLEKGRLKFHGSAGEGLDKILIEHHRHTSELEQLDFSHELMHLMIRGRFGNGDVIVRTVRFVDSRGYEKCTFRTGEPFHLEIDYEVNRPVESIMAGIGLERTDGLSCTVTYSPAKSLQGNIPERGTIRATLDPFGFLPGRYRVTVALSPEGRPTEVYDLHLLLYLIRIEEHEDHPATGAAWRQPARFSITSA